MTAPEAPTQSDWGRFISACTEAATEDGIIDPNEVRRILTDEHGLTIDPRRLSGYWARAARSLRAFLEPAGWTENLDVAGGNAGKPLRLYRWRQGGDPS